jgi:uncharacterized protein (TIGR02996 family)
MNDHDALLHAIGEHPEEDTPRLMYADWLEENGDADRADFVRNQVALGRFDLNDPDRAPLVRKNARYLTNNVPYWRSLLPQVPKVDWGDFNRGLIEEVQAQTEEPIVRHAAAIFAVPGIHVLRLRWLNRGDTLARVPQLSRLRALRMVAGRTQSPELRALFASPHLGLLTAIDLHGNHADDAFATQLAGSRFPDLAEIWLGSNTIGNLGALALANSSHLDNVRVLDLRNNRITDPAVRAALRRRFGKALQM